MIKFCISVCTDPTWSVNHCWMSSVWFYFSIAMLCPFLLMFITDVQLHGIPTDPYLGSSNVILLHRKEYRPKRWFSLQWFLFEIRVAKELCYKPEGSGFETLLGDFFLNYLILPALRFTQPLTEMSTGNRKIIMFLGSKMRRVRRADNVAFICEPIV
jgi:hypothetical protein